MTTHVGTTSRPVRRSVGTAVGMASTRLKKRLQSAAFPPSAMSSRPVTGSTTLLLGVGCQPDANPDRTR